MNNQPPQLTDQGEQVVKALQAVLGHFPLDQERHATLVALAEIISNLLTGRITAEGAQAQAHQLHAIPPLLNALAGAQVTTSDAVISIGQDNQLGNVTITDVAQGNIIKLSLYSTPPASEQLLSLESAKALESFRLEAQEQLRRQAAAYDEQRALLRTVYIAVYQLRVALRDLKAFGESVTIDDLNHYIAHFEAARTAMFASRALLPGEFSAIVHDIHSAHAGIVGALRLVIRRKEFNINPREFLDIIDERYEELDQAFQAFTTMVQTAMRAKG